MHKLRFWALSLAALAVGFGCQKAAETEVSQAASESTAQVADAGPATDPATDAGGDATDASGTVLVSLNVPNMV